MMRAAPPRADRRHRHRAAGAARSASSASPGAASRRWSTALCGRALEPRHATFVPFLDAARRRRSTTAWRSTFPAPHSYTGEDVLELQAHGGPVVLQLLLARCLEAAAEVDARPAGRGCRACASPARRVHRARLPQRQARPRAGRGRRRPDRRQHRSGGALGGALARRRVLARDRRPRARRSSSCACWSRRRSTSPRRRSTSCERADARGRLARVDGAARRGAGDARARARCCAKASRSSSPASRTSARARCSTRWPAPSWRSSRRHSRHDARQGRRRRSRSKACRCTSIDTAGLREAADEVERIGVARTWAEIGDADAVVFLHDLTRARRRRLRRRRRARSRRACRRRWSPRPAARRLQQGRRCGAAAARASDGARASRRSPAQASTRCARALLELRRLAGRRPRASSSPAPATSMRCSARAEHLGSRPSARRSAATRRSSCSPRSCASAHDALGEITGAFTADDLLGAIFGRFCIGK